MLGTDAGAGDYQVTGTKGAENAFPRNREPGAFSELVTAGEDDQFSHSAGARQVFETFFALFPLGMMPDKGKNEQHEGKKGKNPA